MAGNVQSLLGEDGRVVCERCAVADGFVSRLLGLQGRRELRRDEGLLLSPSSSVHTAFMRFAIDVVFLDHALRAGEAEARALRVREALTFREIETNGLLDLAPRA